MGRGRRKAGMETGEQPRVGAEAQRGRGDKSQGKSSPLEAVVSGENGDAGERTLKAKARNLCYSLCTSEMTEGSFD